MNYKKHYSDYVGHMVRFFLKHKEGIQVQETSKAEVKNWVSVQTVWNFTPEEIRVLLERMYISKDPYDVTIERYASETGKNINFLWRCYKEFSEQVASIRGLI